MARYRLARKVMSQMSFGSRTTIRLIEATKAVEQWRDRVPNGILTHTPVDARVWRQNEP